MTDPIEREDTESGVDLGTSPPAEDSPQTERPPGEEGEPHEHEHEEPNRPRINVERSSTVDEGELTIPGARGVDPETTVNLTGDLDATVNLTGADLVLPERDDAAAATDVARGHLKGLLEALIFASDKPIKANELAKTASAATKQVKELLEELKTEYGARGLQLDEVAGGWIFRTNAAFAPFVRDLTKLKPVKLTRAQIETLSILAYRQPITRPEIDDIRGVDCGPVLKLLLERDLVKIMGTRDEPGRPHIYGTTTQFLEFFGLKSLRELPTLREFTDLNEESRRVVEQELGETLESTADARGAVEEEHASYDAGPGDTLPPPAGSLEDDDEAGAPPMNTEIPPPMEASPTSEDVEKTAAAQDNDAKNCEIDPEEEFPDDDDSDFDDDDEDDDDDDDDDEKDDEADE